MVNVLPLPMFKSGAEGLRTILPLAVDDMLFLFASSEAKPRENCTNAWVSAALLCIGAVLCR